MTTERTPLFRTPIDSSASAGPSYMHLPGSSRSRHRQIKMLQCCLCTAFLAVFIIALAITLSYSIFRDQKSISDANETFTTEAEIAEPAAKNTPDNNITDFLNLMLVAWPITDEAAEKWKLPELSEDEIISAVGNATKALGDKEIFEESMASPAVNSPSFKHQRAVSTTKEARIVTRRGFIENHATKSISQKYKNRQSKDSRWSIGTGPAIDFNQPLVEVNCSGFNSKYRTANGTCNNRKNPMYGSAMIPFRRSLNPDYSDGVSAPRSGRNGKELPSARQISIQVHRPSYETDPNFTVMLAVWGQFMDHDITATAGNQGENGKPIECCETTAPLHPECFPVMLNKGDPFYDKYNVSCMNFVRSAPAPTGKFGPRQQLNQATAFIDGSVVYGSNDERIRSLRTGKNGRLRMFATPDNRTLLPLSTDPFDGCNEAEMNKKGHYCFESGDTRSNENLHLTSMHLIWARHHNFLVGEMAKLNPHWDDEVLFQEGRRILGAQIQHITYNEFLPILLGKNLAKETGIMPTETSEVFPNDTYNANVDSSIANQFAAAAFRFAHTLIPGLMRVTKTINSPDGIALHKMLFNPYSLYENKGLDDSIEGAINQPLAKSDPFFTNELSERLFENPTPAPGHLCGLDLVSLNIQRGRDHGLPGYSEWRKHCHLPEVDTWESLEKVIDPEAFATMKSIFNLTQDIDIYSGALSEPPIPGGIIGPLLACLISDQFVRIKTGDSHWYERKYGPQRFSQAQMQQIYNTTLASIICQNSDGVMESQRYVMQIVSDDNPVLKCNNINMFDFEPWLDSKVLAMQKVVAVGTEESSVVGIPNN